MTQWAVTATSRGYHLPMAVIAWRTDAAIEAGEEALEALQAEIAARQQEYGTMLVFDHEPSPSEVAQACTELSGALQNFEHDRLLIRGDDEFTVQEVDVPAFEETS